MESKKKTPEDYLNDVEDMKQKMSSMVKGDTLKGVGTGATIGILMGTGYAILHRKKIFKGAVLGALIGSALSFTYIQIKNSGK